MIIKQFDFISPHITFYHKGNLSHSSIISGIISILSISLIIICGIYFSLDIISRKNPRAFYFNTFVDDAGVYTINSSSFFHYISMYEESNDKIDKGINFTYFRIIGLDTYFHYYLDDKNLSKFDHWLYGYCNQNSDIKGIENLIKSEEFQNAACIKKYFSHSEHKYYNIDEPKFRWPKIAHGTFHPNKTFYNIFVERCKEETLNYILGDGHHCSSDIEMVQMLSLRGAFHLYFIDNMVDVLDYKKPNTKYFYRVENGIDKDNYSINHININPTTIKTNHGLIFENIKKENSYNYDRNEVFTYQAKDHQVYMAYYFWLSNRMFFYERTYKRVQEVVSNIGGIAQFITILAIYINHLYNKFIIIYDTKIMLSSSIDDEKKIYKKANIKSDNLKKKLKSKNDKNNKKSVNSFKKKFDNEIFKTDKLNSTEKKLKDQSLNKNSFFLTQPTEIFDKYNKNDITAKNNDKKDNNKTSEKTFFGYLFYKFSCEKRNKSFKFYENFRIKIISEEHLIKNHLNIYNLLKVAKRSKNFMRNSYHLKDLVNLV